MTWMDNPWVAYGVPVFGAVMFLIGAIGVQRERDRKRKENEED